MISDSSKRDSLANMPLSRQLYLYVLIIAFVSVLLTGYFVGVFYWNSYVSLLNENQYVQLNLAANDLNNWIDDHLEALRFNARYSTEKNLTLQNQIDMSNALMKKYTAIKWICAFKPDKTLIYSAKQYADDSVEVALNLPAFDNAIHRKVESTGKIVYLAETPMLIVYLPVLADNEDVIMVLSSMIDLRYMAANISSISFAQYGYVYIVDEFNKSIASNFNKSDRGEDIALLHDYFFYLNNSSPKTYIGIDNKRMITSFHEIKATQWFLVIEYPVSLLIQKIGKNMLMMLVAFISAISLGLLGASIIYKNINSPLKRLTDCATQISAGDYQLNLPPSGNNELGMLSKAFNTMSERLTASFEDIQHQLAYERMISEISAIYLQLDSPNPNILQDQASSIIGKFYLAAIVCLYVFDPLTDAYSMSSYWNAACVSHSGVSQSPWHDQTSIPLLISSLSVNSIIYLSSQDAKKPIEDAFRVKNVPLQWEGRCFEDSNLFKAFFAEDIKSLVCWPYKEQNDIFGFQFLLFTDSQQRNTDNHVLQFANLASLLETSILKTNNRKKLRETSEKLSITLRSIADAVIATDEEGLINLINPVAENLLGWKADEIIGLHISQVFKLIDPDSHAYLQLNFDNALLPQTSKPLINYYCLVNRFAAETPIEISMSNIANGANIQRGVVIAFRDISDRLRTDAERLRIEKNDALGYLAAGIAHDFNNLLGTILGSVNLAQTTISPSDERTAKILSNTESAIMQGKDIASQLFALNKNADRIEGNSNLLSNLKKMVQMVLYNTKVLPKYQLAANLPPVKLPDGTVNQIITNLLLNSAQAMPSGGEIQVITKLISIDNHSQLPLKQGYYIQLNLIDNGPGIPKETLEKVFLPYYTTKETGTGLGVPTVLTLITMYGGYFSLKSLEGEGTDAELYFPVSDCSISV